METLKYSESLEDLVTAANIAGCLETEEKIYITDDTTLTMFLIGIHNMWIGNEDGNENFMEYAARKLLEEYGIHDEAEV